MKPETFAKIIWFILCYGSFLSACLVAFSGFMIMVWSDFRVFGFIFFVITACLALGIYLYGKYLAEKYYKIIKELEKGGTKMSKLVKEMLSELKPFKYGKRDKKVDSPVLAGGEKEPRVIKELKNRCWVCEKYHCVIGGYLVKKMVHHNYKGKTYVFMRSAQLGCWLAHNKKKVFDFYKDKDWYGWKNEK